MNDATPPHVKLTIVGKALIAAGAVLGYCVGWFARAQLQLTGAIPGAIFAGLGRAWVRASHTSLPKRFQASGSQ
jgi:hypothetical protein